MAGIQNNEELSDNMNAANENSAIPTLPHSLEESIQLAQESEFVRNTVPKAILHDFSAAMQKEVDAYHLAKIRKHSASTDIFKQPENCNLKKRRKHNGVFRTHVNDLRL